MGLEDLTVLPLNFILPIIYGYFAYLTIVKLKKSKPFLLALEWVHNRTGHLISLLKESAAVEKSEAIFSELKTKEGFSNSSATGFIILTLILVVFIATTPTWLDNCGNENSNCPQKVTGTILILNYGLFAVCFAIFLITYSTFRWQVKIVMATLHIVIFFILLSSFLSKNILPGS